MDPSTSTNLSKDPLADYYEEDNIWPFPPNNSTKFIHTGFRVKSERGHGVILLNSSEIDLTSSVTTVFLPVIYIIIFIVGLPTNAMAIWVFLLRMKKKKNPASILLANLALADLLFIIWLPLKIHYHFNGNNWIFGEPLCKVLVGFFYGNMYCSTIFIASISVQRYWAVAHPYSQKLTNRVAVRVSVCVWIVVWLLTIPLYLYKQTVKIDNLNITTCQDVTRPSQEHWPAWYFQTMGIVGYVVPCVVCVVAYLLTFRSLRRSMMNSCSNTNTKKKAVILMIIVLVMFLVCFTPSNILLMVHYFPLHNDDYILYIVALCLGSLNSCLDPFVYYFVSSEFRAHVLKVLICQSEQTASIIRCSYKPMRALNESPTPPMDTTLPALLDQTDSV